MDTKPTNFSAAEAYCNSQGGHLVYYTSVVEQVGGQSMHVTRCNQLVSFCNSGGHQAPHLVAMPWLPHDVWGLMAAPHLCPQRVPRCSLLNRYL
jgi:hypothetical protein